MYIQIKHWSFFVEPSFPVSSWYIKECILNFRDKNSRRPSFWSAKLIPQNMKPKSPLQMWADLRLSWWFLEIFSCFQKYSK